MTAKSKVYVNLEFTPNPNSLKYSVNVPLLERGAFHFSKAEDAVGKSPLAEKLFKIPGVTGVLIGKSFVTITKTDEGDWDVVHQGASQGIEEHLSKELPVVTVSVPNITPENQTDIEKRICEVLEKEIRPALAMDGGDVEYVKFEDGIVYLHLQGACAGCPGATMTLKSGIEMRLKEVVPEVAEVMEI